MTRKPAETLLREPKLLCSQLNTKLVSVALLPLQHKFRDQL